MEPQRPPSPTFYERKPSTLFTRHPNPQHLQSTQEIQQLYRSVHNVGNKLFDALLGEKGEWADAESNALYGADVKSDHSMEEEVPGEKPYFRTEEKMVQEQEEKMPHPQRHGCKCSKIGCLKLYCECFSRGRACTKHCSCTCCHNKPGHEKEIMDAKMLANYRHPGTFKGVPAYVPVRKCTCKKSECRKKYCECFSAGLKCTQFCECKGCKNGHPGAGDDNMEEQCFHHQDCNMVSVHA